MTEKVTLDELEFALAMSYDSEILANPEGGGILWFYIGKTIDCDFVNPPWKKSY